MLYPGTLPFAAVATAGALCLILGLAQAVRRRSGRLNQWMNPDPAPAGARAGRRPQTRAPLPRGFERLRGRMAAAGVEWTLPQLLLLIGGGGVGAGVLVLVITGIPWLAAICCSAGLYVPVWRLNDLGRRRASAVAGQLDQVCVQIVQALSGGLDLHEAIRRQSERAPDPTGAELRRAFERSRGGEAFPVAIAEFGERIDLDEARLFAAGIRLAMQEGARPVPVLESALRALRNRREMIGLTEELAAASRTQALVLMLIAALLFPAMRLVAPAFTAPLFHSLGGQIVLAGDLCWMVFGLHLARSWFGQVRY